MFNSTMPEVYTGNLCSLSFLVKHSNNMFEQSVNEDGRKDKQDLMEGSIMEVQTLWPEQMSQPAKPFSLKCVWASAERKKHVL